MSSRKITFISIVVLLALAGTACAATVGSKESGLLGEKFRNPTPWLELNGDFRFRARYQNIYGGFQNKDRSDPERLRFPFRTRLRGKVKLSNDLDFNIGNTWQLTHWIRPKSADGSSHGTFSQGSEGVFDVFNLTVRNAFGMPLTLVIGRQNLMFGKGWLVAEGTPLDAARTEYFEAIRATYKIGDRSIFDFVYIDQKNSSDDRLKPINNDEGTLMETDERGMIANLSHRFNDKSQLAGYYILKEDMKDSFVPTGTDKYVHTFGGLYEHVINAKWDFWIEGAIQTGHRDHKSIKAYGINSKLNYSFNDARNTKIHIGYESLSGDDASTNTYEGFDPLWGRWPRHSTLLCDVYSRDGRRPSEFSNMRRLGLGWRTDLSEKSDIGINYHLLWVPQSQSGSGITTKDNKFRGQNLQVVTNYRHNKFTASQLLFELFGPGSYYANSNNDTSVFLQYQLVIKF